MMLKGALKAQSIVGLMMNVPKEKLEKVIAKLPALKTPTISPLYGVDWYDLFVVVEESLVRDLIPELKEAGAQGIIELPLNKVVE